MPILSASFTSANTAPGVVPNADTGQVFSQAAVGVAGTPGWQVLSNAVIDAGTCNESYLTVDTGISDGITSVRIVALSVTGADGGLVVRMGSPTSGDCLLFNAEATGYALYRRVSMAYTLIGSIALTPAVGHVMEITTLGTAVTAGVGATTVTVTEAAMAGNTYVGLRSSPGGTGVAKTLSFDDLTCGSASGPIDLGAVTVPTAVSVALDLTAAGPVPLGSVSIALNVPLFASLVEGFGTLVRPHQVTDTATVSPDFTTSLFVSTDPPAVTGPADAPSIWYEFTASQAANWTASTMGFASGATIELYTGPENATADDLTFIATNGSQVLYLDPVTIDVSAPLSTPTPQVETVNLGAVAMTGVVTVEEVIT